MDEPVVFAAVEKLPVKQVWRFEDRDFTPWLANNLDHLAAVLGLDLEEVNTEVPVGPFRVDVVATVVGTDDIVVVENQFGRTDHDHLGKLMTYASGLDASYAVWIAESFRPEHRSALEWANRTSVEGVGFFALGIEALRVGGPQVGVQLVPVVQPDQWAKQTSKLQGDTQREQLYREFWTPVLEEVKERWPGWTASTTPQKGSGMPLPAGRSYIQFWLSFTQDKRMRIDLYVDDPDEEAQSAAWQQLMDRREQIESQLGDELTWEELPHSRGSRVALYNPKPASVENTDQWNAYREWFMTNLGPFRKALQPEVDALPPTSSGTS